MDNTTPSSALHEARATASKLLDLMETQVLPVEQYLMLAKRLARLVRDTDAQLWFDLEMRGYPDKFHAAQLGDCAGYAKGAGRLTDDGQYYFASLPKLEADLAAQKARLDAAVPKATGSSAVDFSAANATKKLYEMQLSKHGSLKGTYIAAAAQFASFKSAIHNYATDTLISIQFGDVAESIFDQLRFEVDSFVRRRAPAAAAKLLAIAERMAEGNPESLAEAMTSCRRLLLTLADSLFPPSQTEWLSANGKPRKVGVDQYKNRLIAFIEKSITSEGTKVLLANDLEHLCARLDIVYEKTSKGVHADVTLDEARLTIIQAYIFMGELARVAKGEAAA
ncbi:hypothetical protein [Paraburkholderia caribensis]|uniref:hypothetical protein n=1 Tax=Paraburkholderia caribensis TaxID=75105 RepID=UPI000722CA5A|nr:hypothetical protein [Paraburkholderia caribensis]ALP62369.1 hypothetical protein AN416_06990 [Paraburkholderia caribensis]AUT52405.1 hypothetical protein C2L66_11425 [Paraburkholderia caribensis]